MVQYSYMRMKLISTNNDIALRDELQKQLSRRFYKKLKSINTIFYVNGKELMLYQKIMKGDSIEFEYDIQKEISWPIYPSQIKVLYEDEYYLIVYKPQGLLSIPTRGEPKSLYQEVLYYLSITNQELQVSILNRLDKETKGLVVVAKTRLAAYYLQPTHEKMIRKYKCLCHGLLEQKQGHLETLIDVNPDEHKRFISEVSGKIAISDYRVLKYNEDTTLVEFILQTGRTHQIRLHTKYIGHPIVGDTMYGIDLTADLHLCSYFVEFLHPFFSKIVKCEIESEWE